VNVLRVVTVGLDPSGLRTEEKKAGVGGQPEPAGEVLDNASYGRFKSRKDHDSLLCRSGAAEVNEIIGQGLIKTQSTVVPDPESPLGVFEQGVDRGVQQRT